MPGQHVEQSRTGDLVEVAPRVPSLPSAARVEPRIPGCAATVKERCRNLDLALLPWIYEITPIGDRNPGGSYDDRNHRA